MFKPLVSKKNQFIAFFFLFSFFSILANPASGSCKKAFDSSRVVAAGGSLTEIIYFLGLEKKLVARDSTSKFPSEATKLPSIGYVRNLSAEGLMSLLPTLILGEEDIGPPNVIAQVKKTSVDFRVIPDTFNTNGVLEKIYCLGEILEADKKTLSLKLKQVNDTRQKLREQIKNKTEKKRVLLILMMRGTSPIVAGAKTSGDGLIEMTGNINVFSNFEGWKPVGIENILAQNPDHIIITTRGFAEFKTVQKFFLQTGLIATNAGKNNDLIVEDGMALLGFSPRTLEIALKLATYTN